jgi:hypothetical protein
MINTVVLVTRVLLDFNSDSPNVALETKETITRDKDSKCER